LGKQLYGAAGRIEKFVAYVFAAFAIYMAVSFSLSRFPETEEISRRAIGRIEAATLFGFNAFVAYLPNLVLILAVAVAAYGSLRILRAVAKAIESGAISLPGFPA
jgi:hypothetical protein